MKFKNRSLWPSCLGGATLGEAAGSSTTLKILTANGQVLRFSEPWSMTAADLLAHTAHPHHMVCEGNPEDFFFHHSRLTKLSSTFDDDSSFDTESVSDRSDTNSFSASPARRSFGSLTAAAAAGSWSGRRRKTNRGNGGGEGGLVGLSPLTPVPSFGSLMVKRFFLRGGDRKDLLGGFLASPIQRLRSVGRTNRASSPWQLRSPGESQHRGRISPLQMSRNAFSDVESEVGSEDGSCDLQVPRFERGRILPLDAELESGRVYYLVPMPRLLPDFGIDSGMFMLQLYPLPQNAFQRRPAVMLESHVAKLTSSRFEFSYCFLSFLRSYLAMGPLLPCPQMQLPQGLLCKATTAGVQKKIVQTFQAGLLRIHAMQQVTWLDDHGKHEQF